MKRYSTVSMIIGMVLLGLVSHTYANVPITVTIQGQAPPHSQQSGNNWIDLTCNNTSTPPCSYGGILQVSAYDPNVGLPVVQAIPSSGTSNNVLEIVNATFTLIAAPSGGVPATLAISFSADFGSTPFNSVPFVISAYGGFWNASGPILSGCSINASEQIIQPSATPAVNAPVSPLRGPCSPVDGSFGGSGQITQINLAQQPRTHAGSFQFVLPNVNDNMDLYNLNEHHPPTGGAQTGRKNNAKAACKDIPKHLREAGIEPKSKHAECPKKRKKNKD